MSAITHLTANGIKTIAECQNHQQQLRDQLFVVQIIDVKIMSQEENKKNVKARITLSDGVSSIVSMFTDKIYKLLNGRELEKYSIIRINGGLVQINPVQNRLNIGSPADYTVNQQKANFSTASVDLKIPLNETDQKVAFRDEQESLDDDVLDNIANQIQQQQQNRNPSGQLSNNFERMGIRSPINQNNNDPQNDYNARQSGVNNNQGRMMPSSMINNQNRQSDYDGNRSKRMSSIQEMYTPIRMLNNFTKDWKIKARVIQKGQKKEWRNAKGEGVLLNADLIDHEGTQIQATFFGEAAHKYDQMLHENHVYLFSNGQVKIANKKFTSIKNDHCLTFDQNAEISEVQDDNQIKSQGFSFVTLRNIEKVMAGQAIDVIGVITEISNTSSIPLKSGQNKDRRNITIADESEAKISLSLWGNLCTQYSYEEGQVMAVKNVRVSDYGGKSLNCGDDHSLIYLNPADKRTDQLMQWSQTGGAKKNLQNLSGGVGGGDSGSRDNYRLVREMSDTLLHENSDRNDKTAPQYFKLSGYISKILYDENRMMYFPGCPECKKKCSPQGDQYWCEKCNKALNHNQVRMTYTVTAKFDDLSDGIFISFMSESAEPIMGMPASDFSRIREDQSNSLEFIRDLLNEKSFNYYTFVVKAALDDYNINEARFKYQAVRSQPLDMNEENQMLLRRLNLYKKKQ
eukprot:403370207